MFLRYLKPRVTHTIREVRNVCALTKGRTVPNSPETAR